eukprot:s3443_g11.t1
MGVVDLNFLWAKHQGSAIHMEAGADGRHSCPMLFSLRLVWWIPGFLRVPRLPALLKAGGAHECRKHCNKLRSACGYCFRLLQWRYQLLAPWRYY